MGGEFRTRNTPSTRSYLSHATERSRPWPVGHDTMFTWGTKRGLLEVQFTIHTQIHICPGIRESTLELRTQGSRRSRNIATSQVP